MAGLRAYQQEIQLNTLYLCFADPRGNGSSIQPYIEIIGGAANIYGSMLEPESPPTGMASGAAETIEGVDNFAVIPNYLYITEASGTITSIILSGVKAKEV